MSVADKIVRLQAAKASIAEAIVTKGGTVAEGDGYEEFSEDIASIPSAETITHHVTWFDYNGDILKEEDVEDGGSSTAPTVPTHQYLEFLYWTEGSVLENITYDIFNIALHKCTEEDMIIYRVDVPAGESLHIRARQNTNKNITIDWGDGDIESITVSTTSAQNELRAHVYDSDYNGFVKVWTTSSNAPVAIESSSSERLRYITEVYLGNNVARPSSGTTYYSGVVSNCKAVVLQSDITALYRQFTGCSAKILAIPNTVTSINNEVGCEFPVDMQYCNLPYNLTYIGSFGGNANRYKKIQLNKLPPSITTLGRCLFQNFIYTKFGDGIIDLPNLQSVTEHTFDNCFGIVEVRSLGSITSIPNDLFNACKKLREVFIPDSVTNIDSSAFRNCAELTTVHLDCSKIISLGANAFNGDISLCGEFEFTNIEQCGNGVFTNCRSIEKLDLGSTLQNTGTSGDGFVAGCWSLKELLLPDTMTGSSGLINGCRSLESINIPAGISTMYSNWIYQCFCLKRLVIPSTVTNMQGTLCTECISLEEVEFKGIPTFTNSPNLYLNYARKIIVPNGFTFSGTLSYGNYTTVEKEDIMAFINNLGNVTGTVRLILGSTNLSKLTDEDKAVATSKGYTLVA